MSVTTTLTFGALLKQLRKRAGMTQADLAAALGYSIALISALERNQRLPDLEAVIQRYIPALALQAEPHLAVQLVKAAAHARGERLPATWTIQRERRMVISDEVTIEPPRLPLPPTGLIGRDQEIAQISKRILGHSGRLLTLVGSPGIGKTHLSLAVAAQLRPHYRDGVVFVPLAAVNEAATMASAVLAAVGSSDASSKPPPVRLIEFLRRKSLLLVLDNFEQLLAPAVAGQAVGLVAALLAECPGIVVLATSRERLHLRAEQRYKVPPLAHMAAVKLFVQRAQAVDGAFSLTAHNHPILETICERLDCLPLAIELCAAQIELFSPTQLLAELQARPLDLLVDGAYDLPPQQRTLRRSIERSYHLLGEEERILLRSLGIFVGGFALLEVAAVMERNCEFAEQKLNGNASLPPLISALRSLVNKSLVHSETLSTGKQRFLLLETIREFALEQLQVHGQQARLRQQHYAAYLQLFRTGDSHLRGPEATAWFARLAPEQDNLRAALQWTFDEGRYTDAAWLLVAVTWFWYHRGHWYEQNEWIAQLLPHRHRLNADLRLALLLNLWAVARVVVEFQPIDHWEGEVMQLLDLCSHPLMHAAAWHSTAYYSYNNLAKATTAWERSIAFARAASAAPLLSADFGIVADRNFYLGIALWGYGDRLNEFGKFAQALPLLRESLAIFQARGSRYEMTNGLGTLGRMSLLQGDLAQAHKLLSEAVTIATEFRFHEMLGYLQAFLGLATLYHGTIAEARRILCENDNFCTDLKDKGLRVRNSIYLAEAALAEGMLNEAEQWLKQSSAYFSNPHRIRIDQMERLWVAACLAAAQQHYQRAATLFGLVEQICQRIDYMLTGPRRSEADKALATVQDALEPTVFAEAFAAGQQMSLVEAFATILAPPQGLGE